MLENIEDKMMEICPVCTTCDIDINGKIGFCDKCNVEFSLQKNITVFSGSFYQIITQMFPGAITITDPNTVIPYNSIVPEVVFEHTTEGWGWEKLPIKKQCSDCKGSKVYVGLNKVEPCRACKGVGEV